ncbi:hypothetical protein [Luteimonas fraxinea]|uniref:hypothetical protein n=1 Tax=Luteimonas fraxinea TaxID=2901869 RepID=UPI001E616354|nr:hypothetical protein [Luteimonas fraxinea]MCD9126678.1 hypothetical protein [Luteimonas fraxinea]
MTSAKVDLLLGRLEAVQPAGKGWRARCPACGGRSRKLSVIEGDEGRLLVHCFGGCEAGDVLQSVGLTLGDLFAERAQADNPENRRRARLAARETQWGAALEMLEHEALIIRIAGQQISGGSVLTSEDEARLAVAVHRVEEARQALRPHRPNWRPAAVAS